VKQREYCSANITCRSAWLLRTPIVAKENKNALKEKEDKYFNTTTSNALRDLLRYFN